MKGNKRRLFGPKDLPKTRLLDRLPSGNKRVLSDSRYIGGVTKGPKESLSLQSFSKDNLPRSSRLRFVVFEDLDKAEGPRVHTTDCVYYRRWIANPTATTTWHGPYDTYEEAWKICERISKRIRFPCSRHRCTVLEQDFEN